MGKCVSYGEKAKCSERLRERKVGKEERVVGKGRKQVIERLSE